ncbi:MAG: hypothetical protein NZ108_05415, partial [Bacteroidia bacterium]|nr:hypothetical protein [Bacteroidia bacterium]
IIPSPARKQIPNFTIQVRISQISAKNFRLSTKLYFCLMEIPFRYWVIQVVVFVVLTKVTFSQSNEPIEIINTDSLLFEKRGNETIRRLIGQVQFQQDSTILYCDSAWHYTERNLVEAFSNVRILVSNQTTITGNKLIYQSDTKVARMIGNVQLTDGKTILTAPELIYFRNLAYGMYPRNGKITDGQNTLTSEKGYYYQRTKQAEFARKVTVVNSEYTLQSDSLSYNTQSRIISFVVPTTLQSKKNEKIVASVGQYLSSTSELFLYKNGQLQDSTYLLKGDTLYYNDSLDYGWGQGNIVIHNQDSTLSLFGQSGIFNRKTKQTILSGNPYLVQILETDTLVLLADTLFAVKDSLSGNQKAKAYHHVRFQLREMQGKCDSLEYLLADSILYLYKDPILWTDKNQVTGDTLVVWIRNKKADSMNVLQNAFIISQEDSVNFNQLKGKKIIGKFRDNQLEKVTVLGNSESIYFAKDGNKLIGMNRAFSAKTEILLQNNRPARITFSPKSEATFYPMHEVFGQKNHLDDFRWRIQERPTWKRSDYVLH